MEVHKHPHHITHKKKWIEYLLEFFMLFLAVFLALLLRIWEKQYRGTSQIISFPLLKNNYLLYKHNLQSGMTKEYLRRNLFNF